MDTKHLFLRPLFYHEAGTQDKPQKALAVLKFPFWGPVCYTLFYIRLLHAQGHNVPCVFGHAILLHTKKKEGLKMNRIRNLHARTMEEAMQVATAFFPYELILDQNTKKYFGWDCVMYRPSEASGDTSMLVIMKQLVKLVLNDGRIINIWDDSFFLEGEEDEQDKEDDAFISNLGEWLTDDEPEQSFSESCREKLGTLYHVPASQTVPPLELSSEDMTVILGGLFLVREKEIAALADLEATSKDNKAMLKSVSMLSGALELINRIQEYEAN